MKKLNLSNHENIIASYPYTVGKKERKYKDAVCDRVLVVTNKRVVLADEESKEDKYGYVRTDIALDDINRVESSYSFKQKKKKTWLGVLLLILGILLGGSGGTLFVLKFVLRLNRTISNFFMVYGIAAMAVGIISLVFGIIILARRAGTVSGVTFKIFTKSKEYISISDATKIKEHGYGKKVGFQRKPYVKFEVDEIVAKALAQNLADAIFEAKRF